MLRAGSVSQNQWNCSAYSCHQRPLDPTVAVEDPPSVDQVRRPKGRKDSFTKDLEKENPRLNRLVADQRLDIQILKDIAKGVF